MKTPVPTRWNSTYDSLADFLGHESKLLQTLATKLNITMLDGKELAFLKEYLMIMKPIAVYLDAFQEEKNFYLGSVVPILLRLRDTLRGLSLKSFSLFRDKLLELFEKRLVLEEIVPII